MLLKKSNALIVVISGQEKLDSQVAALCQSHPDLTGRLSLTIAGRDLDATKVVSSHPIPVSVAGTLGPAGPESHQISWTVLRHCL